MKHDFWVDRKVLVTGGAGFVGANLSRALIDRGAIVHGYDLRRGPSWDVLDLPRDRLIVGDVCGAWEVNTALSSCGTEIVFHLGGMGHIHDCQIQPCLAWETNIQGTWAVLEACRMMGEQIKAVVVASSNHVYGSGPRQRKFESAPWAFEETDAFEQPDVYGTSKACADLIARSYGQTLGVPTAALRHVNCFGPADPHCSHLVTGTICDLLEGKRPVIRGDGTAVKGYLGVEDVVAAYLLLADGLVAETIKPGTAWNAAPSEPTSVLSLVQLICRLFSGDLVPEILGEDLSQSHYIEHLDSSRLRALGWSPAHINFRIWQTWDWYKAHGGLAWAASTA